MIGLGQVVTVDPTAWQTSGVTVAGGGASDIMSLPYTGPLLGPMFSGTPAQEVQTGQQYGFIKTIQSSNGGTPAPPSNPSPSTTTQWLKNNALYVFVGVAVLAMVTRQRR